MKNRQAEGDLFDRTRNKLTLQYSGVLVVFLGLFVVIVYGLLYLLIWSDQRNRLNEIADSEIRLLQNWADQDENPNRRPPREIEDAFSISADQSFYYLIAENGTMELENEIQPELRTQVMESIRKGRFKRDGIEQITMQMIDNPSLDGEGSRSRLTDARFLVTERELLWKGERIAALYIGKEVTFQHDLFRLLLVLLIGMALLFFGLALWLSHLMAREAIIPIGNMYARQREFVADASHELRTPLSVMLTSIEALQLDARTENDSFSYNVLDGMKEEVHSMTKLAGDLLRLARSEAGEFALDRSLFNLREVSESAIHKLLPLAKAKDIVIKLDAPDGLTVNWDAEKLKQLLVLLIDNAVKYTPASGSVDVRLAEGMEKGGRFLAIEVKDSGIGIAAESLPRIFDRFYRQDKARTRKAGGHGLGLAIAKTIVAAGRGTIHADSTPGEGSTFKVRIPL
ncbi:two-component sensor histidine kinase [Paenibacillus hemerocallicola]|uniref:histidine kinase n=1 Tax=Paenibacillus hemerocallicola TaxID=1172614 RepID=A0A5C4TD95_9BACL|nr:ATP-binding protein [Paenibacillus hemerocallicola]TNJ66875.1 two-component sensor histidine kinase [Paenibacillus hemerocallicola]